GHALCPYVRYVLFHQTSSRWLHCAVRITRATTGAHFLSRARLGPGRRHWRRGDLFDQLRRDSTVELLLHHDAPVARHTKLGNVESQHFSLRRDAHRGEHLVETEDAHRRAETPGKVYANADELGSKL